MKWTSSQQLQVAKDETDRTSKELIKKAEDFGTYRYKKHAALAQLQSSYDAYKQAHASTEGSLKALRSARVEEPSQNNTVMWGGWWYTSQDIQLQAVPPIMLVQRATFGG